jgi:hypothetical protein
MRFLTWRRGLWSVLALFLIGLGIYGYSQRGEWALFLHRYGLQSSDQAAVVPDIERWDLLRKDMERWRLHYAREHRAATSEADKARVLVEARSLLEHSLPELMRCWLGTPWDFNGTAKTPGEGKIACGYFVTTVMEAAGFRVKRAQLAQQASQNILLSFLPQDALRLRVGVPYKTFRIETERSETGIYIVGLDTHVGFLVVKDQSYTFIHSSGSRPWCVVEEATAEAHVLERSNYRVLGNLTASEVMVKKWLHGEAFATRK